MSSRLRLEKNPSPTALFADDPRGPPTGAGPQLVTVLRSLLERYCPPWSVWNTMPVGRPPQVLAAMSRASLDQASVDAVAHLVAEHLVAARVEHHPQMQPALAGA